MGEKAPEFLIRPAQFEDCDLILDFIKDLASYERLENEVVATRAGLEKALFGKDAAAEVILGYHGQKPVAFALFFHNFSTFLGKRGLYLEDLYVREDSRGRGIGREMLAYLAKLAIERDCGRLEWWVLDWNTSAIAFYEQLGAVAMNDWTVYRLTGKSLAELAGTVGATNLTKEKE